MVIDAPPIESGTMISPTVSKARPSHLRELTEEGGRRREGKGKGKGRNENQGGGDHPPWTSVSAS